MLLIPRDVYNETIELIEGKKEPDNVLKGLQLFYESYGIRLYNIYMRSQMTKDSRKVKIITALTNVPEGYVYEHEELSEFNLKSLEKYFELCRENNIDTSEVANYEFPRVFLGTGFYFDRIWADEVLNELSSELCKNLMNHYEGINVVYGFGSFVVFMKNALTNDQKTEIINSAEAFISKNDPYHLCDGHVVIRFDLQSVLDEKYGGNLFYYFK